MQGKERGQIALEFIIVYSVVLIVFVLVFTVISVVRSYVLRRVFNSFRRA